jgi:hypothetical protein
MSVEILKKVSVSIELNVAIQFIRKGLCELQKIDGSNDFLYLPMLLLSNGLERMMKIILCLHCLDSKNTYMSKGEFMKLGHKLNSILKEVIDKCYDDDFKKRSAIQSDYEFMTTDKYLHQVLDILDSFATTERYYNLDIIGGDDKIRGNTSINNPEDDWEKLGVEILRDLYPENWCLKLQDTFTDVSLEISQELVKVFEKLIRALSRIFTLSNISDIAASYSPCLHDFLVITDSETGTKNYCSL